MLNKRIFFLVFPFFILSGSCNTIRPFFIKKKKKEDRIEKRAERKIDRKESKIEKKQDKLAVLKNNLNKSDSASVAKVDSIVKLPLDTNYVGMMMRNKEIVYTTFQCKAKIHFESSSEKQNFSVNFRVKKDSIIWASITAPIIGEIARAIITSDSVKAIERVNKRSYMYAYADIQRLINVEVDFETLQNLIIGNAIEREGVITDIKNLGLLSNIFIKGDDFTNQLTYTLADSSLKELHLQTSRPSSSSSMLIKMNEYKWVDDRFLPTQRIYHILDVKGAIELDMDINKADFEKEIDFPFSIPKNYSLQR